MRVRIAGFAIRAARWHAVMPPTSLCMTMAESTPGPRRAVARVRSPLATAFCNSSPFCWLFSCSTSAL
eukprot:5535105-Karenia_brevis.AAC.1